MYMKEEIKSMKMGGSRAVISVDSTGFWVWARAHLPRGTEMEGSLGTWENRFKEWVKKTRR